MALSVVQQAAGALKKGDLQAVADCYSEDAVLTVIKDPILLEWQRGLAAIELDNMTDACEP